MTSRDDAGPPAPPVPVEPVEPSISDPSSLRPRRPRRAVRPGREEPVHSPTSDDADLGWGDAPVPDDDDRLRREVPPHWGRD